MFGNAERRVAVDRDHGHGQDFVQAGMHPRERRLVGQARRLVAPFVEPPARDHRGELGTVFEPRKSGVSHGRSQRRVERRTGWPAAGILVPGPTIQGSEHRLEGCGHRILTAAGAPAGAPISILEPDQTQRTCTAAGLF